MITNAPVYTQIWNNIKHLPLTLMYPTVSTDSLFEQEIKTTDQFQWYNISLQGSKNMSFKIQDSKSYKYPWLKDSKSYFYNYVTKVVES